jgi:hypothetical protein
MPAYSPRGILRRGFAVLACAALAAALATSCTGRPGEGEDFSLVAESMGDIPLPDLALKIDNLAKAHDGSMATRWTTGTNIQPGFFVEIRFPKRRKIAGLILNTEPSPSDFPRRFVVEASADGKDWKEVARGGPQATANGITTITFREPVEAQSLIITANKAGRYWWSIYEMEIKYAE